MEIKKDEGNQRAKEAVLRYLLRFGKENKYRLARVFRIGTEEVIEALQALENERKIEMEGSKAKPITTSRQKRLKREAEKREEVEVLTEVPTEMEAPLDMEGPIDTEESEIH